jgi:hypothetical protein
MSNAANAVAELRTFRAIDFAQNRWKSHGQTALSLKT